ISTHCTESSLPGACARPIPFVARAIAACRIIPAIISDAMTETPSDAPPKPRRGKAAAAMVAAGILLSRLTGLIQFRLFAHYLGTSVAADAYRAAFRVPNMLQNLLGEGVLSASFIPVYARLRAEGRHREASELAEAIFVLLALVASLVVALGILFAPFLVTILAPGFHGEKR